MKTIQVLQNNNKLYSETASDAFYANQVSEFSIHLVFNGSETYQIGKRALNVFPENFLVLNEGTEYSRKIDSINPVTTFSTYFSRAFIEDFHRTMSVSQIELLDDPFNTPDAAPQFTECLYPFTGDLKYNFLHLKQHFDERVGNELLINEYLYHCLLLYYKVYKKDLLARCNRLQFLSPQTKTEILRRLTLAKDFILSNFDKPISLEDISKEACLSVNHLLRTFAQAYNCSPHQFLMEARLSHSRFLLQTSAMPVNEISGMVGFQCPSSYIRLFRRTFKMTPGSYRKTRLKIAV